MIKELLNEIKGLLKEAEEHSNNSACLYDEGWCNGECNAYKIVYKKLESIIKEQPYEEGFMLRDVMWQIINLEIPSPLSQSKLSKRKLQELLKKYEFDDDFIGNVNVDTLKGWDAAMSIVKRLVSDEIHK